MATRKGFTAVHSAISFQTGQGELSNTGTTHRNGNDGLMSSFCIVLVGKILQLWGTFSSSHPACYLLNTDRAPTHLSLIVFVLLKKTISWLQRFA